MNHTSGATAPTLSIGEVNRILVIRALPGLGDLLCASPALRALRRAWPQADLALLGLDGADGVLDRAGTPVDRVIPFQGWPGIPESPSRDMRLVNRFVADLQEERFDLVLQMHGTGSIVNPLALLIGGRVTVGWRPAGTPPLSGGAFFEHPDHLHEIHRMTALVERLGVPAPDERLDVRIDRCERDRARELLGRSPDTAPGYACVHAGAASPDRRWPAQRFAVVGDALATLGLPVVLTGTGAEQPVADAVAGAMTAPVTDLTGRTTLGELAAVVAGATVVVCNDTGVSHLAAALGTPSVVVFVASDPHRWAPLDTTRHRIVTAGPGDRPVPATAAVLGEVYRLLNLIPTASDPVASDATEPVAS